MSTEELIARARKALTEAPGKPVQPRVAVNYMKQALRQVDAHRQELDPRAYAIRKHNESLMRFGEQVLKVASNFVDALASNFEPFARAIQESQRKSDYTLAGDN